MKRAFHRTQITWLGYILIIYFSIMQASLGPVMPFLRGELGMSFTLSGLHFTLFAAGMILGGLILHAFTRWRGRRFVLWFSSYGVIAGAVLLIAGKTVWFTLGGSFAIGFAGSITYSSSQAMLSDYHSTHRASAISEAHFLVSICASLVPFLISGLFRLGLGWRFFYFVVFFLISILTLKTIALKVPEQKVDNQGKTKRISRAFGPDYWLHWTIVVMGVAVEWCFVFWAADFLQNRCSFPRTTAIGLVSFFFLGEAIGRFVGSRFSRFVATRRLLFVALGWGMGGFLIFWLSPVSWLNVAGLFVAGSGVGSFYPLTASIALECTHTQTDKASGQLIFGGGIAILTAPFAVGALADATDIFWAVSLILFLILVMQVLVLYAAVI